MRIQISFYCFILLVLIIACNDKKSSSTEDAIAKDLKRATEIIAKNNESHFKKLKKICNADTSKEDIKGVCDQYVAIRNFKEEYKNEIAVKNSKADFKVSNQKFVKQAFSQLTNEEQEYIRKSFEDSPILDSLVLDEMELESTIAYELLLESEMITEAMFRVLLKDYGKNKNGFHWEIYWDE